MRSRLVVLAILGAAMALSGCNKKTTSPDACASCAGEQVALGNVGLANGDFASANAHFRQAATQDPNNRQAQTGVALTGIFLIQNDPEVVRVLGITAPTPRPATASHAKGNLRFSFLQPGPGLDVGPRAMALRALRTFSLAALNPLAVSDAQNVIKTHVLPQLQDAENRLNVVEADVNFSYPVVVKVGAQAVTVEIDRGDIYALDALINSAQGLLGLLVAYNFDAPISDSLTVKADSLLANGTAFGKLHADGASQLSSSRDNLLLVKTRLGQAVSSILAETDDQTDDVIAAETLNTQAFLDLQGQVNDLDATLRGPIAVQVPDYLGNPFAMQLEAGRFFVPAIPDLKTKLPVHTFNAQHQFLLTPPLTFPDETFTEIFPDMTNARWRALLGPTAAPRLLAQR